jgi:hypothetical protein
MFIVLQSSTAIFCVSSFDQSKDAALEVNTEKTKCMLMSRHQHAGRNHNVKTANRFFAAEFRCLGTATTNRNCIREEIKEVIEFGQFLILFGS